MAKDRTGTSEDEHAGPGNAGCLSNRVCLEFASMLDGVPLPSLHAHVVAPGEGTGATAVAAAQSVEGKPGEAGSGAELLGHDRGGSSSKWEQLWARKVVEAAAATVLREMTVSPRTISACSDPAAHGARGCEAEAGVKPPELLQQQQQQPGAARPPGGSGDDCSRKAAALGTPLSVQDMAALLAQSLLQVLSPADKPRHALPASSAPAEQEGTQALPPPPPPPPQQQQQEQQQHLHHHHEGHTLHTTAPAQPAPCAAMEAPLAAAATAAVAQELGRELVRALVAGGMGSEDASELVNSAISNPSVGLDDLLALLAEVPHGLVPLSADAAGALPTRAPQPLLQEAPSGGRPLSALSSLPSAASSSTLTRTEAGSNGAAPTDSLGSNCVGAAREEAASALAVAAAAQPGAAGLAPQWVQQLVEPRLQDGQAPRPLQQQAAGSVYGGAAAAGASLSPSQSMASLSLSEGSLHGGQQQLVDWLRQQQTQQVAGDAVGGLHSQVAPLPSPSPVRVAPATSGSLDSASALPGSGTALSTSPTVSPTASATMLLPSPCSAAAATISPDGKIGKSWEDLEEGVQNEIVAACRNLAPFIKPQHFDAGVCHWLVQLTTLFGQQAAIRGLSSIISAANLDSVRNMRAFITTRLVDHFEQLVFQQDPKGYAQRRLTPEQFAVLVEVVERAEVGLQWPHFDPKVLETVRDLCADYAHSRLQQLSAKELATVKNVPAYIFTLLSKRGKTAKQAAAAKGAVCIKDGLATPAHIQPSPFLLPHAATPFAPVAQPHPATFPGARGFGPYAAVAANPHPAALVGTGMHLPAMYASAPMHPAYRTAPASQPQPLAAMVAPLPPQAAPRLGLHPVEAARLASMSLAAGSPPHSQAFHHHSMHPAYVNLSAMHAGNPAYATAAAAPQYRAYPSNAHLHAVHSAPLPNPSAATSQASGPLSLLFYPSASLGSEGLPIEPQLSGMVAAHPQPVAVSMAAAPPVTQAGGAAFSFGAPHAAVVASAAGGGGTTLEAGSGKEAMLSGSQPTVFYQISG